VVEIGRFERRAQADERDDVRRGVGERVKTVGDDADRRRRVAEDQLGDGNRDVRCEDTNEYAGDRAIAI
jgi:hypothetical protein